MRLYHGGIKDLRAGDTLVPTSPHVVDDCPICQARAVGRTCTVGEYRSWLLMQSTPEAMRIVKSLYGVPSNAPMDPPSEKAEVYVTTALKYARWYAAKAGNGDLYRVEPVGPLTQAPQDHFQSWTCVEARVVEVIERRVVLDRRFRRDLMREWKKADEMADRQKVLA